MVFCVSGHDVGRTRVLFLRTVSLCYAVAFFSLYFQIEALYGPEGVLPVHSFIKKQNVHQETTTVWSWMISTVLPKLQLPVDLIMDLACLVGGITGLVCTARPTSATKINFLLMWMLYSFVYNCGQVFMHFQWDILLLETGFLCVLLAPLCGRSRRQLADPAASDHVIFMLIRWLLFRMMFSSGVVKLTSLCPAWWQLTALPVHYESQCLPTPLAWFARNLLNSELHKLSVIATYVIEIPLTFLFYAPTAWLRKFTFLMQIGLMFLIMASGNYNFFNLLYIALCFSLMDDSWFSSSSSTTERPQHILVQIMAVLFNFATLVAIIKATADLFFDDSGMMQIQFTEKQFMQFVAYASTAAVVLGAGALIYSALVSLSKCRSVLERLVTLLYIGISAVMFQASVVVFHQGLGLHHPPQSIIPAPNDRAIEMVHRLHLINSYGLFRRMTGLKGRPEIVLEVADAMGGPWRELDFLYKPGNVTKAPTFCLPHQPRLDWQMWFAALQFPDHLQPWFVSLLYRILSNQEAVLDLMGIHPAPTQPPKFIRANLYLYRFTEPKRRFYRPAPLAWWSRELQADQGLPPMSLESEELSSYLTKAGILNPPDPAAHESWKMEQWLRSLRSWTRGVPKHMIIQTLPLFLFFL